jgi:hypothetical protein
MTTARRVFLYTVSLVALALLAVGAGRLLGLALGLFQAHKALTPSAGFDSRQFSLSLAMIITGGGLWWGFWSAIRRSVVAAPTEVGAVFRKLYLNAVQTISALVALFTAADCLDWLLGGVSSGAYAPYRWSTLVVAAAVWAYHFRLSEKEGHPTPAARTLRRWNIYILSASGLIMLSFNLAQFIGNLAFFLPVWPGYLARSGFWGAAYPRLGLAVSGGLAWWFFWFRAAKGDTGSTLRQVYLYLLAIAGGAIAGLVALAEALYLIIGYALGVSVSGSSYFQPLSWMLPALLVAAAVWAYHLRLAQDEAAGNPQSHLSARRVYLYLMSFISLGTLVTGLVTLVGVIYEMVLRLFGTGMLIATPEWWRTPTSASLALLVVGLPAWGYYWGGVLKMVEKDDGERRTRSRRIFLYVVLGIAVIGSLAALVNLVYLLLTSLFRVGNINLAGSLRWSVQVLAVSAPLVWYSWGLVRQDQRSGAEAVAAQKDVTLLAPGQFEVIGNSLEAKLGYRFRRMRSLAEASPAPEMMSEPEIERIAAEIRSAPSARVMVILSAGGWQVIPYQ